MAAFTRAAPFESRAPRVSGVNTCCCRRPTGVHQSERQIVFAVRHRRCFRWRGLSRLSWWRRSRFRSFLTLRVGRPVLTVLTATGVRLPRLLLIPKGIAGAGDYIGEPTGFAVFFIGTPINAPFNDDPHTSGKLSMDALAEVAPSGNLVPNFSFDRFSITPTESLNGHNGERAQR